jgi:Alkylmercury lyase
MNDDQVRARVYDVTMRSGRPPLVAELAAHFGVSAAEVAESLQRLATGRVLVVRDEVVMAAPFSAVATPFAVDSGGVSYFANCIWDALGIPAMLQRDAEIRTSCGDCGTGMSVRVENGVAHGDGLIHFALPARQWWNDIVFT